MNRAPRLLTRVALFSSLIYVFCWATSYLPNVKVIFFVIFSAGFLWGMIPGAVVGLIGMGLWTMFNPYGPAAIPITLAQVFGAALCAPIGDILHRIGWRRFRTRSLGAILVACGVVCTIAFYLPVNIVDAWVYQPFWPRLISALPWTAVSLVTNAIVFPLLFPVTRFLYERENLLR